MGHLQSLSHESLANNFDESLILNFKFNIRCLGLSKPNQLTYEEVSPKGFTNGLFFFFFLISTKDLTLQHKL